MQATSVVSGLPRRTTARIVRGTIKKPSATSASRKAASRPIVSASAPAESPLPVETAVSAAIRKTAIRSSTIRMPTTSSRSRPPTRCSSNALAMIVVLEMASSAPLKRLSTGVQPNARPSTKPSHSMMLHWMKAVTPAVGPSATSLRSRNSSPSENISRMTPSSESVWMVAGSANSGKATCGPTSRPAIR